MPKADQRRLEDYTSTGEYFHFARIELRPTPLASARPHSQDYVELFWLERGRLVHTVNGHNQHLGVGDIVFMRLADVHKLEPIGASALLVNLAFPSDALEFVAQRHGEVVAGTAFWATGHLPEVRPLGAWARRALTLWGHRLDAAARTPLSLDAFLLAVLSLLHSDTTLPPGVEDGPAWLLESWRNLDTREGLKAGVRGFVQASGRTPAHVARTTRQYTGCSPSALVAKARMATAARLLVHSSMAIVEIADEVGLPNLSHFYGQFKSAHGTTPRRYRNRHRGDPVRG